MSCTLAPLAVQWREKTVSAPRYTLVAHVGSTAATAIGFVQRSASRSGRISAMPIRPPTSMMTPQIMKPVLKPASGVAAVSTTLPMM